MRLPKGVSSGDFSKALGEFASVVGKDWVFSSDEDVAMYDDAYTPFFGEPELQLVPGAAVAPAKVEEVQAVVRIANKYKVPLYPVSTGRNLGYGGSSPSLSGSVIVDLKRMNRILEVNVKEGYMVVEPGINFMELYRHFQTNEVPYLLSPPQPGWGSPIGNGLEHGTGPAAGDNFSMVKGLEVVLPNGELLRTGMGAVPNSKLWQNYAYGYGPYIDGMFSQSNFGIVTKAGFWLVPKPEVDQAFSVTSMKTEDMQPLIDALLQMRLQGVLYTWGIGSPIRESMSTNDGRRPYGVPQVQTLNRRRDGGTPAEWDKLGQDNNIAAVRGTGSVRGPAGVVKAQLEYARTVFSAMPGVTYTEGKPNLHRGDGTEAPSLQAFGLLAVQGSNHGHFYFSPMLRPNAKDIFELNDVIRNVMLDAGDVDMLDNYGWSSGRTTAYPKALMILMEFLVTDDIALNRRRRDLWKKLVQACGQHGFAEYRAPVAFADEVMNQYSFNNHSLRRFHESIKDAIDPNGILAPGARGIWPKHLRNA